MATPFRSASCAAGSAFLVALCTTTKQPPVVQEGFARASKQMIEENPSFGYRTVAYLLKFNKNTVQRIFPLRHWQVRKRPVGFRPRIGALLSGGKPAEGALGNGPVLRLEGPRWLGGACTRHRLLHPGVAGMAYLSRSGRSRTAEAALEQATPFLLRSENGLVFTGR